MKIPVCLDRCDSYNKEILQEQLQNQLDLLKIPGDLHGKRVLLKPNLISAKAPPLACSNPVFVAAAASCFLVRGAKVLLGDSPAFGSASHVLKKHGFVRTLSGMDVEFVPFRKGVLKTLGCGVRLTIAAEPLSCDYFVNLPRIKAHEQMGVTMAVKNVFGIVLGARKAWLHMLHGQSHQFFSRIILDLQEFLPPNLVLGDGIEVMHKRGPVKGESLIVGCYGASTNCVAFDRAMLVALDIHVRDIPLATAAADLSLPGAELKDLVFPQMEPRSFSGSGFQVPAVLNPVRFRPFRYLHSTLKRVVAG